MTQYSTAVSEMVLATSSIGLAYHFYHFALLSTIGMLIQAIASICGLFMFAFNRPWATLVRVHIGFSWLAIVLGSALMSAGIHHSLGGDVIVKVLVAAPLLLICARVFLVEEMLVLLTRAMSGFSMLSLCVTSAIHYKLFYAVGGLLYMIAGGAIGSRGTLFGIRRVDLFHYTLAVANAAMLFDKFSYSLQHYF